VLDKFDEMHSSDCGIQEMTRHMRSDFSPQLPLCIALARKFDTQKYTGSHDLLPETRSISSGLTRLVFLKNFHHKTLTMYTGMPM
jgi:hypothetical protein